VTTADRRFAQAGLKPTRAVADSPTVWIRPPAIEEQCIRIEGPGQKTASIALSRTEARWGDRQPRPPRAGDGLGDGVQVSSEAELPTSVVAAAAASTVRADKVAHARKALQAGRVGADVQRLADTLIDTLLGR
jgi:anti-sigma28 factor (negative regulator of flagellin synthesis)